MRIVAKSQRYIYIINYMFLVDLFKFSRHPLYCVPFSFDYGTALFLNLLAGVGSLA